MSLENLHRHQNRLWAFWKVEETEQSLASRVHPVEQVPPSISNPLKRLEYLAGRVLIKELLISWNIPFHGLTKNEHGKPFLKTSGLHISLSHSYPYVAAIIDRSQPVGIDLEQPKEKLLKIAPRVLNEVELQDAATDQVKHCIYWCAKETLIKIHGKKDLVLSKNLAIDPFLLEKQGNLTGKIIANGSSVTIPLFYIVYDNFVVVLNQ